MEALWFFGSVAGLSFLFIVLLLGSLKPYSGGTYSEPDVDDGYVVMRNGEVRYDYEEYL